MRLAFGDAWKCGIQNAFRVARFENLVDRPALYCGFDVQCVEKKPEKIAEIL
jgi:hypothetical protein